MKTIILKIRRILITGFLVSLPLVITIVLFTFAFRTIDNLLGPLVTRLLIQAGVPIVKDFQIPGLGVITTILLVFLIGIYTTNSVGKKIWNLGEYVVTKIPGIRSVYIGAKQIIETFAQSGQQSFSQVVMLEYPRKGIYCLAFITSEAKGEANLKTGEKLISIFLPTTPNPTSGFFLLVPEQDLVVMDMTIEEGVKMIVSAGLVTPDPNNKAPEGIRIANNELAALDSAPGDKAE